MKAFIFICVVSSLTAVVYGRKCIYGIPNTPSVNDYACDNSMDFCIEAYYKVNGTTYKMQGCGNTFNGTSFLPDKCTESGTKTLSVSGMTGQYDCCNDKDNCNDKSLNADATNKSAAQSFAFCLIFLSIIVALFW